MKWVMWMLVVSLAASAAADTLVYKDGRRVEGEIRKSPNGYYIVRTNGHSLVVPERDVKEWIKGDAPAPVPDAVTSKPVTPPPTTQVAATRPVSHATTDVADTEPDVPPVVVVKKKPRIVTRYAAGFPVAENLIVTDAVIINDPHRTELKVQNAEGESLRAELVRLDAQSGLALVRLLEKKVKYLSVEGPFAGGQVQCPAFIEVDLFQPRAEIVVGQSKIAEGRSQLSLEKRPRLAGSPLLSGGKVVGVELAAHDSDIEKIPNATLEQIKRLCGNDLPEKPSAPADPAALMYQVIVTTQAP